jgi:DNA repair exonuclease SbcCD ATPase subunit
MLDATVRFLRMAGENIEVRYLGGIRAGIGKYTDRLLGKRIGEVRLDADLLLSFAEGGEGHSVEFFSTGLRAIADVCLRLALTDELYPKDAPPLILDDPFVALDEPNLAEARTLLLELAEERQIIYLTCHPSRSLRR